MTKVFIGGSRKISTLPPAVQERLDNIIQQGLAVLVGDASGADKAVQSYLATRNYTNVTVFCTGGVCRNNVGGWEVRAVSAQGSKRGFAFYTLKDLAMAQEADYGFMLWDAKSKGTLNNLLNLLADNKKALVFLAAESHFHKIVNVEGLQKLLMKCNQTDLEKFSRELPLARFGIVTPRSETLFAA